MGFGLPAKTLKKIEEVFKNSNSVKKAVIFGSRARDDYRKTSDIDIGLYLDGELYPGFFSDLDIAAGIYKTNVLIVDEVINEKLRENIRQDEIVIYERK